MARVLLLFVDGVGLGDADAASNPFLNAQLPSLAALLDRRSPLQSVAPIHAAGASVVGIDATLGTVGTPQSGTGQAALLTGANAVAMHGRHFGPWVPAALQRLVREESLLVQAQAAGHSVAFANAYPEEVLAVRQRPEQSTRAPQVGGKPTPEADGTAAPQPSGGGAGGALRRRNRRGSFMRAGPPLAAIGAGLLTRHTAALQRGDAVASEIVNDGWRALLGRTELPVISAADAGRNLARIAAAHDLTLFAHYATDYAGHRQDMAAAVTALERLDEFIGATVASLPPDALLFVISDHGNIEDVRTGHTRNPALGLVAGAGHALLSRRMMSLMDVTPTILDALML
jgi:2,3-bisphosphoglycerate-independent phosphoglycerate mutase